MIGSSSCLLACAALLGPQQPDRLATPLPDFDTAFSEIAGGSGSGQARDVFVGRQGDVYLVGGDESGDFPTTVGPGPQGSHDAFVVVLGPDGGLLWSRTIGGPSYDRAYAIEVDEQGCVYVAGRAGPGFPTTPGALQPTFGGDQSPSAAYGPQDGFVVKLSPRGDEILWSTYFGGDDMAFLRDIDVDARGDVYVALWPVSAPCRHVTSGAFLTHQPKGACGVVAKIAKDGSRVDWATYLGGTDGSYAMANPSIRVVDQDGSVVVAGGTASSTLPTSAQAFDRSLGGKSDVYVARLRADGSRLVFGTYLGGSAGEYGDTHNLALDADGNIVVAATTLSADFPTTQGAAQRQHAGNGGQFNQLGDGFVTLLSADGSRLMASTFLGGRSGEGIEGVAVDERGAICVSGGTYSDDLAWAPASPATDRPEAFVAVLSPDLSRVVRGIALGGSDWDLGLAIAAGPGDTLSVVGETKSQDLPLQGAWVRPLAGPKSGFAVRLVPAERPAKGD